MRWGNFRIPYLASKQSYGSAQKASKQAQYGYTCHKGKKLTLDKDVLEMVKGADIDFTELPIQGKPVPNHQFSKQQTKAKGSEVTGHLKKGAIRKTTHSKNEYVSLMFVRPKKDNKWRTETAPIHTSLKPHQSGCLCVPSWIRYDTFAEQIFI